MARRTTKSASTREDILQAAIQIFAQHGFECAKIAEIARQAGVQHPLVSYYFTDKEALWDAVIDQVWGEFGKSFIDVAAEFQGIDPQQQLRMLYRRYVLFSARHPEIHRLVANESFSPGPRLDRLVERHYAPFQGAILHMINNSSRKDNPPDPLHIMVMMNGAVLAFIAGAPLIQRVHGFDPTEQSRALAMADGVIDAIIKGIS
jgi:TetR/AcrR family transcriptional regulator